MPRRSTFLISFLMGSLMSGCAIDPVKNPYLADVYTDWKVSPIDDQTKAKMSYLGRFILSSDDRGAWAAKLAGIPENKVDGATATGALVSQVATGNMFSGAGVHTANQVSLAINTLSLFLPDGSMKKVSGIYLPEVFEGVRLESADQALAATWDYAEKQLNKAAATVNRTAVCWLNCQSKVGRSYLLTRQQTNSKYYSDPQYMLVSIALPAAGMIEAKPDPLLRRVLGYQPKWTSGDGNTFPTVIYAAEPVTPGDVPSVSPKDNMKYSRSNDLAYTRMGRDFLRAYHADGFSYYGQDDTARRFLTFNGKIYQFLLTNSRTFIQEEVTGEILAKK